MVARLSALLLGVLALAALRARHDTLPADVARLGLPERLWHLSGQFEVMTGLLAALAFLAVARGWRIGARPAAALGVALGLVALTTPILPATLWPPFAPLTLARTGLALALPLGGVLWWLAFAPKDLALRDLPLMVAWPLAFLAAAALRGQAGAQALVFAALALGLALGLVLVGRLRR